MPSPTMASQNFRAAIVIGVALVLAAFFLSGGLYTTTRLEIGYVRTNRLTGSMLQCGGGMMGDRCAYATSSN